MYTYITLFEIIGTIAFALSGAMKAADYDLDLFGIIIIGVTTATGGGIFRDLILGKTPPSAFANSQYVLTAAVTAFLVFCVLYIFHGKLDLGDEGREKFEIILLLADSLGLGIFTAMGVRTAWNMYPDADMFLYVFCGVVTGVGGGLLRDTMLSCMPAIFTKHIYASACIAGAIVQVLLFRKGFYEAGLWTATIIVVLIRLVAARRHWSLPKIPKN